MKERVLSDLELLLTTIDNSVQNFYSDISEICLIDIISSFNLSETLKWWLTVNKDPGASGMILTAYKEHPVCLLLFVIWWQRFSLFLFYFCGDSSPSVISFSLFSLIPKLLDRNLDVSLLKFIPVALNSNLKV